MDKKILMTMVALVVVALLVFAVALIASGGIARAGGFTKLFDKLVNDDEDVTYNQRLKLPDSWEVGDTKTVSDTIVSMKYEEDEHGYLTTLWFVYKGDKWNNPERGTYFFVPDDTPFMGGWLRVEQGLFSITVWSASNLPEKYDVGDTITVKTQIVTNVNVDLAFHYEWRLASE